MRPQKTTLAAALLATLLFGGQAPVTFQSDGFQRQLSDLTRRGFTYRMLDNGLVELTDPLNGEKRLKSLREPGEAHIRAWASQRGIPILEIDPNTIDTSKYTGWYKYWSTVPLSNSAGVPLMVGDLNHNGKADVYGLYRNANQFASYVYEVTTSGAVTQVHQFVPRMGAAMQLTDIDRDSLYEVNYQFGDSTYNFEQPSAGSLPTMLQFVHAKYEYPGTAIWTREIIGTLDGDSLTDFLYRGTVRDSAGNAMMGTFVAEYNDSIHDFQKVWMTHLAATESAIGGYEVNDFDADGRMDFVASDVWGNVWVVENTGDNAYAVVWSDTIPFSNTLYQGSGDVDNDGWPEFFVGGMTNGNWTTVFGADSGNNYSPRLLIHLGSGGSFDEPQYLTADVDADGKLELVICAGTDIYIFKSNAVNQYYLWYLKRENARDGIQFYDFNEDGRKDFIISKTAYVDPPGYFRNYADIYVATELTSAHGNYGGQLPERLMMYPNYPNPFNPSTVIRFFLPVSMKVTLVVYDIAGREVQRLFDGKLNKGEHAVRWNADGKSSGIYFCRLYAGVSMLTRKLLLLH